MATEKKQSFLGGAAVLAFGIVTVKIIGAVFKIPLRNILGEGGSADFSNAYNIYATLLTISTAGASRRALQARERVLRPRPHPAGAPHLPRFALGLSRAGRRLVRAHVVGQRPARGLSEQSPRRLRHPRSRARRRVRGLPVLPSAATRRAGST